MSNKVPQIRFNGYSDAWEERKLGEIFNYEQPTKYIVKSTEYDDTFNTPVLTAGKSFLLGYTDEITGIKNATVDNPVVIFDDFTTGSHYVDFPFKIKSSAMKLLSLNDNSDNFYFMFNTLKNIKYVPQSHERHWISKFSEFEIYKPSQEEQQKIGSFFKQLDDTIALHQRKLDLLKEQKKGYLQKMFPKNGAKVPELRFAGFADAWEQRKLSSGLREYTDRVIVEDDKEYYQISVRNNFGGITLRGSKMGNKIGRKRQAKINLTKYPQTLIFTRQTVEQGGIGWVDKYCDGAIVTENMPTISLDTSVFSKYFLTNLFQTRIFYKNAILDNVEGGSAQIAIHESKFLSSTLLFPNLDEQKKIGAFFKQLDDTIALHQRKLDLLKEQKKGFLQNMFV